MNRFILPRADSIITIGRRMAEVVREDLDNKRSGDVHVVSNWADIDVYRPTDKRTNLFALAHGQQDVTTLLYSGNIGQSHGLLPLLPAADLLRERVNIKFLIVGDGLGRPELERYVREHNLSNVYFEDRQPWSRVPAVLAMAEVAVVSQDKSSAELSVPSKTYTSLASGSAILALTSRTSDLAELVEVHQVGVVCSESDPAVLAKAICELIEDKAHLDAMRKRARKVAEEHFSAEAARQGFLRPLMSALHGPKCSQ